MSSAMARHLALTAGAGLCLAALARAEDAYSVQQCDPATLKGCGEGSVCAKKDDDWAQCVTCDPEQFQHDCPYLWHESLTAAAEAGCGLTCLGQRNSQCVSIGCDPDPAKTLTCVSSSDEWSQCVDCSDAAFSEDCGHWSSELLGAAEVACNAKCTDPERDDPRRIRLL